MKKSRVLKFVATLLAGLVLSSVNVLAHSFGVVLISPQSGELTQSGLDFRNGFMLATTQRDSHPNEESDGHLGGLDVYVSLADSAGDVERQVLQIIGETSIDIVLSFGLGQGDNLDLQTILVERNLVFLVPGALPQEPENSSRMVDFVAAFELMFGHQPNQNAAMGYNVAQRIEQAVRALGSVDDRRALQEIFTQSASHFVW